MSLFDTGLMMMHLTMVAKTSVAFWQEAHFKINSIKLRFVSILSQNNWTFGDRRVDSEIDELRPGHFKPPLGVFITIIYVQKARNVKYRFCW